jgi:hypothetical protein
VPNQVAAAHERPGAMPGKGASARRRPCIRKFRP